MKVTVFNGSPAGKASATHLIAASFLKGAAIAGAEIEHVYLKDYNILQCQGCFACWFKTLGRCVLADEMEHLLNLYRESDIICFATPIYTWNMTALLKNFIDRLIPLKVPQMMETNGHLDMKNQDSTPKKIVILSNSGFPGENNFDVLRASVACAEPILEIYRNCGKLLKSKNPDVLQKVNVWLESVEAAGQELVLQNNVSEEIKTKLQQPLMTIPEYMDYLGM